MVTDTAATPETDEPFPWDTPPEPPRITASLFLHEQTVVEAFDYTFKRTHVHGVRIGDMTLHVGRAWPESDESIIEAAGRLIAALTEITDAAKARIEAAS